MRVLVCGGRDFKDRTFLFDHLDFIAREMLEGMAITSVIHGGATGADALGAAWAHANNIPCYAFEARWDDLVTEPVVIKFRVDGSSYNAAAGGIRNQRMLDDGKPDLVVAFPGGKGTADMVSRARKSGVRVITAKP